MLDVAHKRKRKQNSIAIKLLALVLLITFCTALVGAVISSSMNFKEDMALLHKRLDQVRISSLPSITASLWSFDEEQLRVQVESLLEVDDVVQVEVSWRDWNDQPRVLSVSDDSDATSPAVHNDTLIKEYPLIYEDESTPPQALGTMRIHASLNSIYQNLWQRTRMVFLVQGTQTLVLAILLYWLVRFLLIRHLETVTHYARQLTLYNLEAPLMLDRHDHTTGGKDELDDVVDAFNHMRKTLVDDLETKQEMEEALRAEKLEARETRRQKSEAEAASRAKSQFLATMSHEIRTPMNGVIGMVELLRDTPLNENQRHYLDVIYRSGVSLLDIINDVLDYSKIEAGKLELENTDFNLETLIDDCVQLFGAKANDKRVELIGNLLPGTPKWCRGDPTRLRQILINLLGNAFKFTEEGVIKVEARLIEVRDDRRQKILFSVEDTGVGIKQENVKLIFDSFSQADNSTTRKYGGTGLGLAICKRLTELMGGEIGVEAIANQSGSRFWFSVVFEPSCNSPAMSDDHAMELEHKRLLIVEDNLMLQTVLQLHAESWQMQVSVAATASAAEQLIEQHFDQGKDFDFIAIDYSLPDGDGMQLAATLSPRLVNGRHHMFIFTGTDSQFSPGELAAVKVEAWLRKPLMPKRMRAKLIELAGATQATQAPAIDPLPKSPVDLAPLKILVAEDNSVNRMVIKGMLAKMNGVADFVTNGNEAVDAVTSAARRYDLVLMDCEMPELDGFDATRQIREHERNLGLDATPIAALTAHALEEHREAVFACGMNYYLSKPMTFDSLTEAVTALGLVISADRFLSPPELMGVQ